MASSLSELTAEIMKVVVAATKETESLSIQDMYEGTEMFYGGGTPKVYERTGKLGTTPKTSGVTSGGTTASFRAYLDQSGGYTTGKRPSMATVLDLANYGGVGGYRPTVGTKGFWEYSEHLIEDSMNSVFSSYFG